MNRLHLDFTIIDAEERRRFLNDYLQHITFTPTDEELETMGNYLLWGKEPTNDPLTQNTFNKKDTIAAKAGIEIRTSHGTWDNKEKAESLDALIEAPTFNEASLSNEPIHYTTPKNTFSRAAARKNAPPTILAVLEELWQTIDQLELILNFYDLKTGKRKTPPRDELLQRFSEEEQNNFKEKANHINPYQYLKKRHELVELRKQQFTYKDFYAPTLLPSSYDYRPLEPNLISWDFDILVLPLGLFNKENNFSNLIFQLNYDPAQYTFSELELISDFYWFRTELFCSTKPKLDFRNQEDVYQIISNIHELEDSAEKSEANHIIENNNKALLDTLWFYIDFSELSDLQKEILQLKIDGNKNLDIARYINQKYEKSYTTNYISTIFKQKIIKKINEAAQYHYEIIGNLFFPENFRKCNFCGRTLLLHSRNFVKKSKSATGFNSKCKRCEKERRDANKKKRGQIMSSRNERKLEKYMDKFAKELIQLPVQEYLGILTICGIKLFKDEERKETKSAEELFNELFDKVELMSEKKRKNLLMIMRRANKDRGKDE